MQNYALRGLNKMEINMLGEFVAKIRLAKERYGPILEHLRRHEIPEAYPTVDHSPSLYGEQSLDEGSLMIRDEAIRMCGYCWLANS